MPEVHVLSMVNYSAERGIAFIEKFNTALSFPLITDPWVSLGATTHFVQHYFEEHLLSEILEDVKQQQHLQFRVAKICWRDVDIGARDRNASVTKVG